MPAEKFSVSLKPTSFFEQNPANDVPRSEQKLNRSTLYTHGNAAEGCCDDASAVGSKL